jgi:hypothetical protein
MTKSAAILCFSVATGLSACTPSPTINYGTGGTGGATATGGSTGAAPGTGSSPGVGGSGGAAIGGGSNSSTGGANGGTGASPSTGGTGAGATGGGGTGGAGASGGTSGTGGSPIGAGGGASDTGGSTIGTGGVTSGTGGTSSGDTGGVTGTGGGSAGSATGGEDTGPGSYALPPPSQCHNQDIIDYQEGCRDGEADSVCGGKCKVINACQEDSTMKPYADIAFICPRFMLFSKEMKQAAIDDDNTEFNYAIVGHDTDRGGIDGNAESTCCQCYQLVFAYPGNDRQCLLNPDSGEPVPGVPVPPPLIAQSFNTAATPTTFDVYMAAGGFGANNACDPNAAMKAKSGKYLYTQYPSYEGQALAGAVKAAQDFNAECKTQIQWVTTESLSSQACQARVAETCSHFDSNIPGLADQAIESCTKTNGPEMFYHLNWAVYVKKVECPQHLTEVTGCRLAPQGLPPVDRNVTTAEQALADPSFSTRSSGGQAYETTTMEDCCRPSCAATDWVAGRGLQADGKYNAFYSCNELGVPYTEPE